jgi:hypothetical protein
MENKKGEMPRKAGRPKIELEDLNVDGWKLLDSLIVWSAHQAYIADELGISEDTLNRRIQEKHGCNFAEYRNKRKEKLRINIKKKQYEQAMGGNTSMLIWLGKNECGQSDRIEEKVEVQQINLGYTLDE